MGLAWLPRMAPPLHARATQLRLPAPPPTRTRAQVGEGRAEGLLSPDCGDRRTVLGVVTVLLLAPMVSATRTRATTGASALGVVAILGWAAITLCLFLVAASNDQLQPMHWCAAGRWEGWEAGAGRPARSNARDPSRLHATSLPLPAPSRRWPSSPTFKSRGFESAVQMVGVLPILVVACLCQMSLLHMVRVWEGRGAGGGREGGAGGRAAPLAGSCPFPIAHASGPLPPARTPPPQMRDVAEVREGQIDKVSVVAVR